MIIKIEFSSIIILASLMFLSCDSMREREAIKTMPHLIWGHMLVNCLEMQRELLS